MQLIAIVLTLEVQAAAVLPAHLGRSNHAMVLNQIERIDGALARRLHDGSGARPLTCSGLLGAGAAAGNVTLAAGETVRVRVTGLNAPVAAALQAALIAEPPAEWSLHRTPLRVLRATADGAVERWAGSADYAQLLAQAAEGVAGSAADRRLRLHFAAPAAFRSGGMTMPLPLPGLLFGSLLDRWNAFSAAALDKDVRDTAQAAVAISHFRLTSAAVAQKEGGLEIGCMGDVTYEYLGGDPYWLRQLRALAAYAFYSGVGLKTTVGMGQCVWRQGEA